MQVTTLVHRLRRVGRRNNIPAPPPRQLAAARLAALPPGARGRLLSAWDRTGGGPHRDRLHQALAAGHAAATVQRFARRLAPLTATQLRQRTRLVDSRPGPARLGAVPLQQLDGSTCGPAVVLVARALVDPIYAWWLTTGDAGQVAERLAAEQQRIHAYANRIWPRMWGTTPWALVSALNHRVAPPGVRYGWRLVDDTDPISLRQTWQQVVAAVAAGYPVPVLLGGQVPRHWVLLTGLRRRDGHALNLVCYNPAGRVMHVPLAELLTGQPAGLDYPHVQAVVLPYAAHG